MARIEGKIYLHPLPDEGNVPLLFNGGDEKDLLNYRRLSTAERVFEATSGERYNLENLPSLRDLMDSSPELSSTSTLWPAMMFAGDEEKLQGAVAGHLQDARIENDENGSSTVRFTDSTGETRRAYLNKPGFSMQDTSRVIGEGAALTGAGKLLGVGKTGVGMLSNAARMFGAGSGGSAGQDVASGMLAGDSMLESVSNVDVPRAVQTGALETGIGTGLDIIVSLAPVLRQKMAQGASIFDGQGGITQAGRNALEEAGIVWDNTTQAFRDALLKRTLQGGEMTPAQTAILAEADSLPVPVPLTRGQVTGSPSEQLTEDQMRKGVYGEPVERRMNQFVNEEQTPALESNLSAIQQRIAGGSPIITRGQGAEAVQQQLGQQRLQANAQKNQAYDEAKNPKFLHGGTYSGNSPAVYSQPAITTMADGIQREWAKDFAPDILDGAPGQLLKQLRDFAARDGQPVTVRELFEWRTRLNNSYKGNDPQGTALLRAKDQFDSQMDSALDRALITGDPNAVDAWRNALAENADFMTKYRGKDTIELLTNTRPGTNASQLDFSVAPNDAANFIFNASNTGFITKRNLQRDLLKMKKLLPESQWNQLRQELFLRIASDGRSRRGDFSGLKFKGSVNQALEKSSAVMSAAFTKEERALLEQFSRVANRAHNTTRNTSNTAAANARNLKDIGLQVASAFQMRGPMLDKLLMLIPLGVGEMRRQGANMGMDARLGYQGAAPRPGAATTGVATAIASPEQQSTEDIILRQQQ